MKAEIRDNIVHSPYPNVEVPVYDSTFSFFKSRVGRFGERTALVCRDQCLNFTNLLQNVQRCAARLQCLGIGPGERLYCHVTNNIDSFVALCGVIMSGATFVTSDITFTTEELLADVKRTDSTYVLADGVTAPTFNRIRDQVILKGWLATNVVDNFTWISNYEECSELQYADRAISPENIAFITQTSGTTSASKSVEVTQQSFIAQICCRDALHLASEKDVWLGFRNISYFFAFSYAFFIVCCGGNVVLVDSWEVPEIVDALTSHNILDEAGEALGPMHCGEILFQTPYLMRGYYKNVKATAERIDEDGWIHTGDVGYYNASGRLFLDKRTTTLLTCAGRKIDPAEIEDCLLLHTAVADAAVTGFPCKETGHIPAALVVLKEGYNSTTDIAKDIRSFVVVGHRVAERTHTTACRCFYYSGFCHRAHYHSCSSQYAVCNRQHSSGQRLNCRGYGNYLRAKGRRTRSLGLCFPYRAASDLSIDARVHNSYLECGFQRPRRIHTGNRCYDQSGGERRFMAACWKCGCGLMVRALGMETDAAGVSADALRIGSVDDLFYRRTFPMDPRNVDYIVFSNTQSGSGPGHGVSTYGHGIPYGSPRE
ncbi:hypothetical protein HPB49_006793 [Dermacentor silvarum]|uniref:Uncharacterized protein n=1 Tax=Dermacentor silvarum TaxID=543639 RepID=A0ACB8D3J9_DERSI|nr:hypothetical protein HPB49_006793 [Dermacentor silvarum]